MRGTLFRYVLRLYAQFFVALLGGILAIFLVADFVDRAKYYQGEHWARDALELYGFKLLVAIHQLAPGVLLLAAAVTLTFLKKRGELTGMRSLTFGPSVLFGPIALLAVLVSVSLIGYDDWVVGPASAEVDQIVAKRFHHWGEWLFYFHVRQWFSHGNHIFNLQSGNAQAGFQDVTILTVDRDFHLERRLDAKKMTFLEGTMWRLDGVTQRTFLTDTSPVRTQGTGEYDLGVGQSSLSILPGRPEQMSLKTLRAQIRARREVGLPVRLHWLALHNRFAYALAGIPAALLAVALALRRGRSADLMLAFVEGLVIALVLWSLMVVGKSLVLGDHLSPGLAAWLPILVMSVGGLGYWYMPQLSQALNARGRLPGP